MGIFDTIQSKFPLPLDGVSHLQFQSKDMPYGGCGAYEIRENGEVWLLDGEFAPKRERDLDSFRFYTLQDNETWIEFRAIVRDDIVTGVELVKALALQDHIQNIRAGEYR